MDRAVVEEKIQAIVQSVCLHRLVDFERFAQAITRELPDR